MHDIEYQPIIEPFYRSNPTNWAVSMDLGRVTLEQGSEKEVLAANRLTFEWTPAPGLIGAFDSRQFRLGPIKLMAEGVTVESSFQVFESGPGGRFWSTDDVVILHVGSDRMTTADIHVPNLPDLLGTPVGDEKTIRFARQEASFNGWSLIVDPIPRSAELKKAAKAGVANLLTHVIRARRPDGSKFDRAELFRLLDDLYLALSFAFGDYLGPTLTAGRNADGHVVVEVFRPTTGFGWRSRSGVASRRSGISELLGCLGRLFLPDQEVLSKTIWWYLEACWSLAEASVVLAQAALERIAYHHLVNVTGQLTESKFEKLPAADRIRSTMTLLNIPFVLTGRDIDIPTLVTRSRNQQVHPKTKGKLLDVWEAREAALHAVELLLLRTAGYEGPYHPRASSNVKAEALVPWAECPIALKLTTHDHGKLTTPDRPS